MSGRHNHYTYKCAEKSCGQIKTSEKKSISFFLFPKKPIRYANWLKNCQMSADNLPSKSAKLCGKHFEKNMFTNDLQNRLHSYAIPTLFPDRKDDDGLMDTSLGQFEYSDKVMNSTESLFYSSNDTPINISDPEYSKSFINTDMNNKNDILALPFNDILTSTDGISSPGDSFMNDITYDPTLNFLNNNFPNDNQAIKVPSGKARRHVLITKLKKEKKARTDAEKTIIFLNNKLIENNTVDHFYTLCEKYLPPSVLSIVKSHIIDTRDPRG